MDNARLLQNYIVHHRAALDQLLERNADVFSSWVDRAAGVLRAGKKIMLFGNGGSAAEAQHIAAELSVKFWHDRSPLAAMALHVDSSAVTAAGNDYGFDFIFSRQIDALGQTGDMAIGYSTSGKSANVLRALESARAKGMFTVGLTGSAGISMTNYCDLCILAPSAVTPHIQEMHTILGHAFCAAVENVLNLVKIEHYPWKN